LRTTSVILTKKIRWDIKAPQVFFSLNKTIFLSFLVSKMMLYLLLIASLAFASGEQLFVFVDQSPNQRKLEKCDQTEVLSCDQVNT